jgi:hypothetical protein
MLVLEANAKLYFMYDNILILLQFTKQRDTNQMYFVEKYYEQLGEPLLIKSGVTGEFPILYSSCQSACVSLRDWIFRAGLGYTPLSRLLIDASRSVLVFFCPLKQLFFFVSLTLYNLWIWNFVVYGNIWDRMWEEKFGIFIILYIYFLNNFYWILNIWKS